MSASEPPKMFHVRQPVNETFNAGLAGAGVGLLASAVQNSLQKHKAGAMGIFTRTGGTIALCTFVGGLFAYASASLANYRQKEDGYNGAAGGCAAGLVLGAAARSVPVMAGSCAGLGALVGSFQAAGSSLVNGLPLLPNGAEKADPESPLLASTQERRARFFKKLPETE
ncbi:unnamed protein product [Malassezia sympodialis ATCC 42132]|uniref:Uncharacterized protein n=1 Tax=Malassezia sympodialis (strain ATCC 42132) TaxID=1230383 RepID=M5ELY2_MALS4|nr:uncharacterized protein MSY001_1338 [Malassezia sympodialis ATCC 42132]CCU98632.1 unnamed protein product [Malassezia sympodialis ATCC 42132]SHO79464.1 Uncharacterized protein MSYG_3813 [Malassezia sympodialis ATCC 42132]|eukprot:XP_018739928.1 uncharacterized protein MSY001_1338 [Malassezia sympodialis ATCC 42132]